MTPRVGDRLGRYTLCAEIARGGMATVFLGRVEGRIGPERFVAVKCITPTCADDASYVEMFYDEASLVARVQHANVCAFVDFDEAFGMHFLVMELVAGRSLSAVVRSLTTQASSCWRLEYENALVVRILIDACEALHAVHELTDVDGTSLGAVHRDVSPSNLLVGFDGHLKLIDFGVALASGQRHRTRAGVVKGKYSYLAPELIRGRRADRRADIWALGVVAWELLTHRQLFDQDSELAVLDAISGYAEIPSPSSIRPGVSENLDELVMRALRRSPKRRYRTAREMGKSLNRYLTATGFSLGAGEVAEAMDVLFPGGFRRDRDFMERASRRFPRGRRHQPLPELAESLTREQSLTATTRPGKSPVVLTPKPGPFEWLRRGLSSVVDGVRQQRWIRAGLATVSLAILSVGWLTCHRRPAEPAAAALQCPMPAHRVADTDRRPNRVPASAPPKDMGSRAPVAARIR